MPLLSVFTSASLPEPYHRAKLLRELSALVAEALHKPEPYVMIMIHPRPDLLFGGSADPALYAELKNVGSLDAQRIEALSALLSAALSRLLEIPGDRIYIEFTNVDGAMWGHAGGTFG